MEPATIGFFLPTRSESQPKNTNQNRPAKAPAPTTSSAAEFSMRCGPVRKNSAPYMAVYQMTVSPAAKPKSATNRSEEHTSELQSLMRISYAVFCLKKNKQQTNT